MEIKHIVNGEDMESVRNKLNAIIDFINATFPVTKSYLDLENKPAIDGIELMPDTKMKQFSIPVESLPTSLDLMQLFIDAAKDHAELIAKQVAQQEIADAYQITSIPEATGFADDSWKVLVYVPQPDNTLKLYQTTLEEVTKKAVWASNRFEGSIDPETLLVEG